MRAKENTGIEEKPFYEFGPFRLDKRERLLLRNGEPVQLTAKVFDLLLLLVGNRGRALTKDELMQRLWPDTVVEENNLTVNMSALRKVLGDDSSQPLYIETIPRHGYRFVADVQAVAAEEELLSERASITDASTAERDESVVDAPINETTTPGEETAAIEQKAGWQRRTFLRIALAALAFAALAFALYALLIRARQAAPLPPINSIAVLPLESISSDAAQGYFADGMTDALIGELAKIKALRVISRTSAMYYKGMKKTLPEIAAELNVDVVVEGSVMRSGDRVQVRVQLIRAVNDQHLWSETYDYNLRDVLLLQSEAARAIAREIQIKLTPQEQTQFESVRQVAPEAYDSYLRGQFYFNRQNRDDNETAILNLERAVAIDPTFAEAWAQLAQAYVWKLFLFSPGEKQWEEKAFVAVEKALSLNPYLAVAHLARGRLLWTPANHFPHERAIREYRRALELNPNLDEARNQLALIYCHIGAFDAALEEAQRATEINPTNDLARYRIGQTLTFQGKYEQALSVLRALPKEVNPALIGYQTAWALFNLGRKEEASQVIEQSLRDNPEDSGGLFTSIEAVLAASAGQQRKAEEKIKQAVQIGKGFGHFHHTAYHIACAYALMNKPEQAIKWLESAAEDGFPCYPLFERDANLDSLRQNAHFVSFMTKQFGAQ